MRSRALRILLLVFEALWLNVIVPGHRRGAVPLPGEKCVACEPPKDDCCPEASGSTKSTPSKPVDPAAHCAICYFAARLSPPPVIDFTPPRPQVVGLAQVPPPIARPSVPFLPTYDGRAPPRQV